MTRVAVYIDGFNLYFGLRNKFGRRYLWLDLQAMAQRLLHTNQELTHVSYFTARVRDDEGQRRQSAYLDALAAYNPLVRIHDGRFQDKTLRCRDCGSSWNVLEEKETDVNMAVGLLGDAVRDSYDTALVVSGDSDLCPAVREMKELFPTKRIIAAFPPSRVSKELRRLTDGYFTIGEDKVRQAQLPDEIITASGIVLQRPKHWT